MKLPVARPLMLSVEVGYRLTGSASDVHVSSKYHPRGNFDFDDFGRRPMTLRRRFLPLHCVAWLTPGHLTRITPANRSDVIAQNGEPPDRSTTPAALVNLEIAQLDLGGRVRTSVASIRLRRADRPSHSEMWQRMPPFSQYHRQSSTCHFAESQLASGSCFIVPYETGRSAVHGRTTQYVL